VLQGTWVGVLTNNDHRSAGMGWIALGPVISGAVCAIVAYALGAAYCNRLGKR
jgi:hypothetical protein